MTPAQLEFSPVLAVLYAVSIYAFMLLAATLLLKKDSFNRAITVGASRYGSIDGLRGLLATGVLVHHTFTEYIYFSQGEWNWSSSSVLNQLGQTSVALFFMITAFLFTIKASVPKIDWMRLYASRVARLFPLYAVIVFVLFALVFYQSDWDVRESVWKIAKEFVYWITFGSFGRPDINAYPMTWTMIAGVNWSLKYEVMFYVFAVPSLHVLLKFSKPKTAFAMIAGVMILLLIVRYYRGSESGNSLYACQFLGGILSAVAFQIPAAKAFIQHRLFRYCAAVAVGILLCLTHSYSPLAVLLSTIIFASVVGGASLFGLLNLRSAIWLGDVSYGIYLMHGMFIWITLSVCTKFVDLAHLDLMMYWLMALALAVLVSFFASTSYTFLERPVMLGVTRKKGSLTTASSVRAD